MGDYLLMKNFIIVTMLFFTINLSSNELSWVDEQIEAIKPERSGLKSSSISSMKDPFIFLKKYKKSLKITKKSVPTSLNKISATSTESVKVIQKKKNLSLSAVINKSALINSQWYKKGDTVNGYKLSEVNKKSIVLTKKSKKLVLSTQSINKNLNFKNK